MLKGKDLGRIGACLHVAQMAPVYGLAILAIAPAIGVTSAAAQSRDCALISQTRGEIPPTICLPGTSIDLADAPPAVGDLLKGNPDTATGLLFQQAVIIPWPFNPMVLCGAGGTMLLEHWATVLQRTLQCLYKLVQRILGNKFPQAIISPWL